MNATLEAPRPTRRATPQAARNLRRIAVVSSSWHREIVEIGTRAMQAEFERAGLAADVVDHFDVPGAFELPYFIKQLAQARRHGAIIACGLVVNGGIYRHEFVANAVIDGLMRVQLECGVPVLSAVLTPRDFHEHGEHQRFFEQHFVKKGTEVAQACLGILAALESLGAPARSSTAR